MSRCYLLPSTIQINGKLSSEDIVVSSLVQEPSVQAPKTKKVKACSLENVDIPKSQDNGVAS